MGGKEFMLVFVFVLLAFTMKSYADNCSYFKNSCADKDIRNLKKSETAFYIIAAAFAVLAFMVPVMPFPKFVKNFSHKLKKNLM